MKLLFKGLEHHTASMVFNPLMGPGGFASQVRRAESSTNQSEFIASSSPVALQAFGLFFAIVVALMIFAAVIMILVLVLLPSVPEEYMFSRYCRILRGSHVLLAPTREESRRIIAGGD